MAHERAGLPAQESDLINVDEVIAAMNEIGRALPKSLRETSEAGLAVTPTAKAIEKRVYPD